jgi:hypothetical protein
MPLFFDNNFSGKLKSNRTSWTDDCIQNLRNFSNYLMTYLRGMLTADTQKSEEKEQKGQGNGI